MLTTTTYYAAPPVERAAIARAFGWRTHRADYDALADARTASDRAIAVLAAMQSGKPRPAFGRRRAVVAA